MSMNTEQRAMLYGLASVACWSTVATAFKLSLSYIDVWQLMFYATLSAALTLLLVVSLRHGFSAVTTSLTTSFKQHWRLTILLGLLNPVIYYIILFKAYDMLPAQVAQSINYTWSLVLTLMAVFFLNQKIKIADLIAAGVCYGGVFLIATQGNVNSFVGVNVMGIGLALLSTFIWAGYWILNMRDQREAGLGLCLNFTLAVPLTFCLCIYFSDLRVPLPGLAGAVYVGLIEMAIGFLFWSAALRLAKNASRINNLIFLSPFVSLIIIQQVLGEAIFPTTIAGLVMIIFGLILQQYAHRSSLS